MLKKNNSIKLKIDEKILSKKFKTINNSFNEIIKKNILNINPNYNIEKINKDEFKIIISIPGYCKKNLEIKLKNKNLYIKGEKEEKTEKEKKIIYKEIFNNKFILIFNINKFKKISNIFLKNGLLNIFIKK